MDTSIKTVDGDRVNVSQFDDGVWLSIQVSGGSAYTTMTVAQAKELLEALQTIINHEVV
jgi:hypothetical protein